MALNIISAAQNKPNNNTSEEIQDLLYYASTDPNTVIQFKSSNMLLHIYSDTSYLSDTKAKIISVCHYLLSDIPTNTN